MNQAIGADAGVRELIFTPTEIAFLAGAGGATRTLVTEILSGEPLSEVVQASVIGGLIIRQWLWLDGDEMRVDGALNGLADVMGHAERVVLLSLLDRGSAFNAMLFLNEPLTAVAMSRGAGVLELAAMQSQEVATDFLRAMLHGAATGGLKAVTLREVCGEVVREFAATSINEGWAVAAKEAPGDAELVSNADDAVARLLAFL